VYNILEYIISYQKNWTDHLKQMDRNRTPKLTSTNLEDNVTQEELDEDGETRNTLSL
jgi:hypothetical protein